MICLLVPPAAPWILAATTAVDTQSAVRKVIQDEIKSNKHVAASVKSLEEVEAVADRYFKSKHDATLIPLTVKHSEKEDASKQRKEAHVSDEDSSVVSMPLSNPTKIEKLKTAVKKHPITAAAIAGGLIILLPVLAVFKVAAVVGAGLLLAGKKVAILTGIIAAHKAAAATAGVAAGGAVVAGKNKKSSTTSTMQGLKIEAVKKDTQSVQPSAEVSVADVAGEKETAVLDVSQAKKQVEKEEASSLRMLR